MTESEYSDSLVCIAGHSLCFRHYYFPRGSRTVDLSEIDRVEVLEPTRWTGRWRIHGTGDLRTWFPRDSDRPRRDRIFCLHLRGRWRRIGFTAEDPAAVIRVLRDWGVPVEDGSAGTR